MCSRPIIHIAQLMFKRVVPPLAFLASWRLNLPAFMHDADGTEYPWTVYPITRSKTPSRLCASARGRRIRMGMPGQVGKAAAFTDGLLLGTGY